MDNAEIRSLFLLFSGEEEIGANGPFIDIAVAETEKMLLPGCDTEDMRLNFLAAAIANERFQQAKSARDRTRAAYAGKMLAAGSELPVKHAHGLVLDYMRLCEDILSSRTFFFMSTPFREEEQI